MTRFPAGLTCPACKRRATIGSPTESARETCHLRRQLTDTAVGRKSHAPSLCQIALREPRDLPKRGRQELSYRLDCGSSGDKRAHLANYLR